jgi:hypothetical protein
MKTIAFSILLAAALSAWAEDAPRRKSGLWEMKVHSAGMAQPVTVQQCVDQKTDDLARQQGARQQRCSKTSVRREAGKIIAESECQVESSTAKTRAVVSGDLSASYAADVRTTFTPPLHGVKEQNATMQARWVGACKAGQKPGDTTMPGAPSGAGKMDPEAARRMAEEMRKRYQK